MYSTRRHEILTLPTTWLETPILSFAFISTIKAICGWEPKTAAFINWIKTKHLPTPLKREI